MPTVYTLAARFRGQLLAEDDDARESLFAAYRSAIKTLDEDLAAVTTLIANARRAGETVSASWLYRQDRYQSLLLQVAQEIRRIANQAAGTFPATQAELVRLAESHMRDLSRAQVSIPTPGIGVAAGFNRLDTQAVQAIVGFLSDGSPLLANLDTLPPLAVQGVRDALTRGVILGKGVRDIAKDVRHAIGGNGVTALRIAHNATLNAYREASHLSMKANRDILAGWYWLAALGAKTPPCASCVSLHGTFHKLTERLRDHLMGRCFPSGTLAAGPRAVASTSRYYRGELVTIRTAAGNFLSCTPNHPIATLNGWVAAGLLEEGSYVVSSTLAERAAPTVNPDDYQMPAPIEEIARTLGGSGDVSATPVPCTPEHFHGDGEGSEIYVVRTLRALRNGLHASVLEPPSKQLLAWRDVDEAFLPGQGRSTQLLKGLALPALGRLCGKHEPLLLFGRTLRGQESIRGGGITPRNTGNTKTRSDDVTRHAEAIRNGFFGLTSQVARDDCLCFDGATRLSVGADTLGIQRVPRRSTSEEPTSFQFSAEPFFVDVETLRDAFRAFPGDIQTDRVLEVSRGSFAGHVYNLQTPGSWYIAGGIVVHNCTAIPVIKGEPLDLGSGEAWLEEQDEETQREVFGAGNAWRAWTAGRVPLSEFTTIRRDPRWGHVHEQPSLKELLGAEEALQWRKVA